jgi:hypothetical protein
MCGTETKTIGISQFKVWCVWNWNHDNWDFPVQGMMCVELKPWQLGFPVQGMMCVELKPWQLGFPSSIYVWSFWKQDSWISQFYWCVKLCNHDNWISSSKFHVWNWNEDKFPIFVLFFCFLLQSWMIPEVLHKNKRTRPPRAPKQTLGMILLSCPKFNLKQNWKRRWFKLSSIHSFITYARNKRKPYLLLVAIIQNPKP